MRGQLWLARTRTVTLPWRWPFTAEQNNASRVGNAQRDIGGMWVKSMSSIYMTEDIRDMRTTWRGEWLDRTRIYCDKFCSMGKCMPSTVMASIVSFHGQHKVNHFCPEGGMQDLIWVSVGVSVWCGISLYILPIPTVYVQLVPCTGELEKNIYRLAEDLGQETAHQYS